MKVYFVLVCLFVACSATPKAEADGKLELLPGVVIEKDANGDDKLDVKFMPGELRDAARTFEEARGKVKKYTPLLAGLGMKVITVLGLLFGGLTLLVTKALVVAKVAFFAAAALGLQKFLSSGLVNLGGKIASFPSPAPQWAAPTAPAPNYPYARSASIVQDASDLAFKSQLPS